MQANQERKSKVWAVRALRAQSEKRGNGLTPSRPTHRKGQNYPRTADKKSPSAWQAEGLNSLNFTCSRKESRATSQYRVGHTKTLLLLPSLYFTLWKCSRMPSISSSLKEVSSPASLATPVISVLPTKTSVISCLPVMA